MSGRKQKFRELQFGSSLIVGEGFTELCYFKNLKTICGYHCCVQPRFCRNTGVKDIRRIIEKYSENPISIIVVTDMDVVSCDEQVKKDWEELKRDYKKNKDILFCESKPCIEYWFLLHFKDVCPPFNSPEVIRKLKTHIKNYQKSERFLKNEKWVKEMSFFSKGGLKEAKKRAKRHKEGLSYSKVYLAIEELEKTK